MNWPCFTARSRVFGLDIFSEVVSNLFHSDAARCVAGELASLHPMASSDSQEGRAQLLIDS